MDFASPDHPACRRDAERAARIAFRTDARCLANTATWFRRTWLLMPWGFFLAYLAARQGAGWWAAVWCVAWTAVQIEVYRLGGRLRTDTPSAVRDGMARVTVCFWLANFLHALLLPVFFIGTGDSAMLTVTLLSLWLAGPTVISAAGIPRAYAGTVLPTLALSAGWIAHGQPVGYFLALLFSGSLVPAFFCIRRQRETWEEMVTLIDDNETLAKLMEEERDRAEAASQAKTRFFAAASHDLRQPLHALSINATTLQLVANRSGDPVLKDLSQGIGRALQQSRGLLDGLLDISRLDAGAVRPCLDAHDVGGLLRSVQAQYGGMASQRGLFLEVDLSDPALAARTDADQFLRMLGNLVDNAIKFTGEGGVVLTANADGPRHLVVRVRDTGPGIPATEQEKVFEEFYQVGNPSRDRSRGLGLGLAIVRRTAALLDVQISLTSAPGSGCEFKLRVPSAPHGSLPMAADAPTPGLPSALSVLVVDDDPDILHSILTYLRQLGWAVRSAESGEEAERLLADFAPDVLVVDFRLQEETALDVLARLRRRQHLPAVIVTGDTSPERLRELSCVAASVLHKPVDGARLALALAQAVDRAQG